MILVEKTVTLKVQTMTIEGIIGLAVQTISTTLESNYCIPILY